MSLLFDASGELATIPDATSIQDLTDEMSVAAIVRLANESTAFPRIFDKVNVLMMRDRDALSGIVLQRTRQSAFANVSATFANLAHYAEDRWLFIGGALHETDDARCILVTGDQTHLAAPPSTYAQKTAGSGLFTTDIGNDLILGNRASPTDRPADGALAWFAMWSRALAIGEFHFQQREMFQLLATRRWDLRTKTNAVADIPLGIRAPLRAVDISGYGNHGTITNATRFTPCEHVRRARRQLSIAAATKVPVFQHHYRRRRV